MIYELREYYCTAGRLPDLIARFQEHTLAIWRLYGIRPVGFFRTYVGRSSNSLTYVLEWDDLTHKQDAWGKFLADEKWLEVRALTEADGPLIEHIDSQLLEACITPVRLTSV